MRDSILSACLVVVAAPSLAAAPDAPPEPSSDAWGAPTAEVGVVLMSTYLWRGQTLADAPVWQPSATLGWDFGDYGAVKANLWSSLRLTGRRDGTPLSGMGHQELDHTLTYETCFASVDLKIGHVWYTFPNSHNDGHTEEFFVTAACDNAYVTPTLGIFWDYRDNADRGLFYANLALSHTFKVAENLTVTPAVACGLSSDAYTSATCGERRTAFLDQTAGVSVAYAVSARLVLGAQLNVTWIADRAARRADYMGRGEDLRVWGGVSATYSF